MWGFWNKTDNKYARFYDSINYNKEGLRLFMYEDKSIAEKDLENWQNNNYCVVELSKDEPEWIFF